MDKAVLDVSVEVFHSDSSTAIAKSLNFSLFLSPAVHINESDIEVAFHPPDFRSVTLELSTIGNKTLLNIIDIGDLARKYDVNV